MQKFLKYTACLLLFVLPCIFFAPFSFSQSNSLLTIFDKKQDASIKLLREVMEIVKKEYVEDVSDTKLVEYALSGMLSSLDPHSDFFDEKSFKDMKISTSGEFSGIGAVVTMYQNRVKVIAPYEDGPAYRAGIQPGDYIMAIDGIPLSGIKLDEVLDKLRGSAGTSATLTIYRESTESTLKFTVEREKITIIPVKSKVLAENIGYFKITSFNEKSSRVMKQELEKLLYQPSSKLQIQGLVLDLRSNPGGLLDQAVEIADMFLSGGDIVKIQGRNPQRNRVFRATAIDLTRGLPIVLLINEGTASAPEIVAGALQDNHRAIILGETSFGKGSVQTVIPFRNGMAVKLTTDRYYTPSGRSIQASGIIPDIHVAAAVIKPIDKSNVLINSEAMLKGHLLPQHTSPPTTKVVKDGKQDEIITEQNDFQLLRAIDLVKGMALYKESQRSSQVDNKP